MALRFDPAAFLAPGGIASGLDDLGSAVVNALNRRADRKYAREAEDRARAFQTSERQAGQMHQANLQQSRIYADQNQQNTANAQRIDAARREAEAAIKAQVLAPLEVVEDGVSEPDEMGKTYKIKVRRPMTPEEAQAELQRRDFLVGEHAKQFNHGDLFEAWKAYRPSLEGGGTPTTGTPEAPAPIITERTTPTWNPTTPQSSAPQPSVSVTTPEPVTRGEEFGALAARTLQYNQGRKAGAPGRENPVGMHNVLFGWLPGVDSPEERLAAQVPMLQNLEEQGRLRRMMKSPGRRAASVLAGPPAAPVPPPAAQAAEALGGPPAPAPASKGQIPRAKLAAKVGTGPGQFPTLEAAEAAAVAAGYTIVP